MAEAGSAYVSLLPSTRGFGRATEKQLGGEMSTSGKSLGSKFGTALKVGGAAVIGGGVLLGGLLKSAFGEAQDAAKVGAQTAAVIKSTGGVAGVTAKHVSNLSESLSEKIGVDDEAIQAGQNMLLTFSKVRNEVGKGNRIFDRATVTASDMAAAFGGDATSNSKMLGKALNDPIRGVSALTRVGVSFTEQQKKQIEKLQESGDVLGAQKVIMGEVEKQTSGSARAQATAADKMGVAWGNLKEKLGTALMPMFNRVATFITDTIIPGAERLGGMLQNKLGPAAASAGGFFRDKILPVLRSLGHWVMDKLVPALQDMAEDVLPAVKKYMGEAGKAFDDAKPFFRLVGNIIVDVLIPGIGKLAKVVLPVLAQQLRNTGKVLGAIGRAGKWLWNEALQPVFRLIVNGVAKTLKMWGEMFQLIGNVPGMGWVGDLGDKLVGAAEKAHDLSQNIKDIPDQKTVNLDVNENWVTTRTVRRGGMGAVPGLASGGIVTRPTLALVGEGSESEAVMPLSRLSAMLNHARTSGDGGTGRTTLNVYDRDNVLIGTMEAVADGRIHGHDQLAGQRARAL